MIVGGGNKISDDFYSALRENIPHYSIFVMIGVGASSYLTNSILPLREIMPHDGLFVMIGGGDIKLADHFYSAPSRNYAPLCYICDDWGWGI